MAHAAEGRRMIEITEFEEVTCIKMSLEADGKPVYWVAAYLVDGLLIDTGCAHTAGELVATLDGRELDLVVNTHFHEDHVGADRAIIDKFGVPVFAHRDSVPRIGRVAELNPYQEFVWGFPEPAQVSTLGDEVDTDRFHFEVIEAPGHSIGHVALFERDKGWCFSGDIFITERPKVIRADEDAVGLMESMRMLAALPSERLVLFTSMGKVIEDGRAALLSCADYFQGLLDQARGLQAEGLTPVQIRERIFGEGSSLAGFTGGHFSSDNLVESLLV
jgi:glyoxylase-like metal-dependent hydrolase (beta-lactamase superfamily II)